jgi:hypothetical protein
MYVIAMEYNFDPDRTAIGSDVPGMTIAERYILVLYYTIVTFTTTGQVDASVASLSLSKGTGFIMPPNLTAS